MVYPPDRAEQADVGRSRTGGGKDGQSIFRHSRLPIHFVVQRAGQVLGHPAGDSETAFSAVRQGCQRFLRQIGEGIVGNTRTQQRLDFGQRRSPPEALEKGLRLAPGDEIRQGSGHDEIPTGNRQKHECDQHRLPHSIGLTKKMGKAQGVDGCRFHGSAPVQDKSEGLHRNCTRRLPVAPCRNASPVAHCSERGLIKACMATAAFNRCQCHSSGFAQLDPQ